MIVKPKANPSSKCAPPSSTSGDKQVIKNNPNAILPNGIHSTYLLNTMTNSTTDMPSTLNGNASAFLHPNPLAMYSGDHTHVLPQHFPAAPFAQNPLLHPFSSQPPSTSAPPSKIQSIATTEMPSHVDAQHSLNGNAPAFLSQNPLNLYGSERALHHFQPFPIGPFPMNPYSNATVASQQHFPPSSQQLQSQQRQLQQHQLQQQLLLQQLNAVNAVNAVNPLTLLAQQQQQQMHRALPNPSDNMSILSAPQPSIAIASVAPCSPNPLHAMHSTPPPIPYAQCNGNVPTAVTVPVPVEKSHSKLSALDLIVMSEGKDNETDGSLDIEIRSVAPMSSLVGIQQHRSRCSEHRNSPPVIVDDESNESKDADRGDLPALSPKSPLISRNMPVVATLDEIREMTASLEQDVLAQEMEKKGERIPAPVVEEHPAESIQSPSPEPVLHDQEIDEIDEIASAAVQEVTQLQLPLDPVPSTRSPIVGPTQVIDQWQDSEFIARRKETILRFLERWDQLPTTSEVGERAPRQQRLQRVQRVQRFQSVHRATASSTNSNSQKSRPSHPQNRPSSYALPPGLHKMKNGKPIQKPMTKHSRSLPHRPSAAPSSTAVHSQREGRSTSLNASCDRGDSPKSKYFLQSPSYAFQGTFEEAKSTAVRMNRWIMLNIQDTDLFTAQWSNPLLWKHKRYGVTIQQNFVFFNCIKFADTAVGLINLYNVQRVPSVCIIDPYSNVKRYEFEAPSTSNNIVKLREQIVNLLHSFPNPGAFNDDEDASTSKPRKPPILNRNRSNAENDSLHSGIHRSRSLGDSLPASGSPPHRPRCSQSSGSSSATSPTITCAPSASSSSPTRKGGPTAGFPSVRHLEISALPHIYCNPEPSPSNIWDVHYPYHNLKSTAYVLSTRQNMDWNDWMLIITKCSNIVGAIPSEQHIEFLRSRNGEMSMESAGSFNGWWSEQRVAEYVANNKFGLLYEGGLSHTESGRDRKKFLKNLTLARRPTFKQMLVLIPGLNHYDRDLLQKHSLSITPYAEYDKMDNITSFQLWLSFITFLSVNMYETSAMYRHGQFQHDECTNFCFKLGNKWKLPLSTLYNDIKPLISHSECKPLMFSYPKIATDAAAHCSASYAAHYHHGHSSSSSGSNKYQNAPSLSASQDTAKSKSSGLAVNFLSKSGKLSGRGFKYDTKRTKLVQSYEELESVLAESEPHEVIDFPFPLFCSGWFSFNTLSLFATILEQHLDGTWVNMYSASNRKQFKQIFETNKNTRRRSVVYSKLQQQRAVEHSNQRSYLQMAEYLSPKNQRRFEQFWSENKLHWTDLVIDPTSKFNHNRHRVRSGNDLRNPQQPDGSAMRMNVHRERDRRRDGTASNERSIEMDNESIASMHYPNHNNLTYRKKKRNRDRKMRSKSKGLREGKERRMAKEDNMQCPLTK